MDSEFIASLSKRDTDISEHLQFLYVLPFAIGAKVIVELGCGQSTYALLAAANELEADHYAIDLTEQSRFRNYEEGREFLKDQPRHHFILGDSLDIALAWDKPIDFLFIDTSHTYHQTVIELKRWGEWVRKGGLIAMHDTGKNNTTFKDDCRKAMLEVVEKKEYVLLDFHNQNGFAILRKI